MAMVFGLEHVINIKTKVAYNYLVTLLPFKLGSLIIVLLIYGKRTIIPPWNIKI